MSERNGAAMRLLMGADAVWDGLLGLALLLLPVAAVSDAVGFPAVRPWPVYCALGVAMLAMALVLARAARGIDTAAVCKLAALGNAAGVVVAVVLVLVFALPAAVTVALLVAAFVTAVFAALEAAALSAFLASAAPSGRA
ncbi:hypothetical protein [Amycolatopsis sp. CA-230715]|uniref:hypothetical protein n=1 Tax=Amycolatopsis sp. CA-230715 TaxID=2745196 RepID=UPI001C02B87F|nr:hypothetical protein [Amycolatopsis sp. CA-230715]QWF79259.1 hypothetical protein HUW46_02666 [Amycolatopsis sp. CA-230715]